MNPYGRHVAVNSTGDDVKLLHDQLTLLGFAIPEAIQTENVFDDDATFRAVKGIQNALSLEASGVVDEVTAAAINTEVGRRFPYVVRGTIRASDGRGVAGIVVRAYDKELRTQEDLGECTTNSRGEYLVRYSADKFSRAEKGTADLRVAVCNDGGRELVSSEITFNATHEETVDLTVPGLARLSEVERNLEELEPVLQGLAVTELTEADVSFLAGDTGIPRGQIEWLAIAARLAMGMAHPNMEELPARRLVACAGRIPMEAFYGWFREALPTEPDELFAQSSATLFAVLKRAIDENIVPARLVERLEEIRLAVDSFRAHKLLTTAPAGTRADLGTALRALTPEESLTDEQTQRFALLHADMEPGADLWRAATTAASRRDTLAGCRERAQRIGYEQNDHRFALPLSRSKA